ncbi:energy-coupling factor transport system substrate-specific component [Sediminihabitans luteus]|uniref:Energy-coupling factor transport system substrate-specific component n=1 Tax=Sediminihabitans luteus TaxID=1138585 RepID=A0A2M9CQ67_9CELL|nr:ECF transporter S component [Sediminihabitans luteus]PJJ74072.1 energy-coupling factor transport system substrate-specific component [Sediminihabitans luteus]GII98013.1 ABC transporter permease [Sediminihabitans luteus]
MTSARTAVLVRRVVLLLTSVVGLGVLAWPLAAEVAPRPTGQDAPWLVVVLATALVVLVLSTFDAAGMDARTVAVLGMLAALGSVLRLVGAGTGGVELVFFLLVLAGYVYGPTFGFALGALTLLASALLTAGVGPWLPFQALAAAWVGGGAGLLGRVLGAPGAGRRGRVRAGGGGALPATRARRAPTVAALAVYTALACYAFGALMNLWFWPFALGEGTAISYVPGAGVAENLRRFTAFTLATSTLTWDTVRAVVNAGAVVVLGPAVIAVLARANRHGTFAPTTA